VAYRNQQRLAYSGASTSKFGIYRDRFQEALDVAREFGLRIERIHFHTGCGYLNPQLDALEETYQQCVWFLQQVEDLREVNVGGGLGVPLRADDDPLDLRRWCGILEKYLAPLKVEVSVEPGDYIVKDSGVLLLSVTYVERKQEVNFVGLNGGFPLAVEPAFYDLPCEPVLVRRPQTETQHKITLAGNINEALDVWARDLAFPEVRKGDVVALLNAGGYASSMSSDHCLRGRFAEYLLL
jgi:diaminopimelate decarboxylase